MRTLALVLVAVTACARPGRSPRAVTRPDSLTLVVAGTTDVHGWLRGWDYFANAPDTTRGLTRVATIVDSLRSANPDRVLLVDAGDLLQGTLDLLVLRVLGAGPNHGYGITARLHQLSDDVLRVEEGSLYPALYRMEEQGLIEAEWRPTSNNRNAKFYALTRKGRRAAQAELDGWLRLSGAVARVLRALEQEA